MQSAHQKTLILERRAWTDAEVHLKLALKTIEGHITRLTRDAGPEEQTCSFCGRAHSDPAVASRIDGRGGASICNICIHEAAAAAGLLPHLEVETDLIASLPPRVRVFAEFIANEHEVPFGTLMSDDRTQAVAAARDELCWRLLNEPPEGVRKPSESCVGQWIGRDRTSVRAAAIRYASRTMRQS